MVRRNIKQEAQDAVVKGIVDSEWEYIHGTTTDGNLPQHKKYHHVGHCWCPCPFDTTDRCSDLRTVILIGVSDPSEGRSAHVDANGKEYYMTTSSRGSVWGFECTFSGCPYEVVHNVEYFYT